MSVNDWSEETKFFCGVIFGISAFAVTITTAIITSYVCDCITDREAINAGLHQQTVVGKEGVYWVKPRIDGGVPLQNNDQVPNLEHQAIEI